MAGPAFGELVTRVIEAMGLQMESARRGPEGILVRSGDGFLLAFVEDPNQLSLETIRRWLGEVPEAPVKLVVLTPKRLPPALGAELLQQRATLVEAGRFAELVRSLGFASYLGEEPPGAGAPRSTARLLPSALLLDSIMGRAKNWLDWGVPALSLRFYRQAAELKPEFDPARVGIGRSLIALGLTDDADRTFDDILRLRPADVEARLGKAAVFGARGRTQEETRLYREILDDDGKRLDVRAQLVAALIADRAWSDARKELEQMLGQAPEDPQIRFLYSAALEKSGKGAEARRERDGARRLGLDPERERALCLHLGLPPPEFPVADTVGSISEPPALGPTPSEPSPSPSAAPARRRSAARPTRRAVPKNRGRKRK